MNNSSNSGEGKGGTFCRFTIGSGEQGASTRLLRYIAHPQAVRDGAEGVWVKAFPVALLEAPYPILTQHLLQMARWMEQEEIIGHRGRGEVRTHYQAILSFEEAVTTTQAKSMLSLWMETAFPKAQAAAFLHRNTRHLHIHVWIGARQIDGKKINLSARAFRQLDEHWNRIYSQAMNRDEREHLLKKSQTERFKHLRREGKEAGVQRPVRVGDNWTPALFNERERERLKGNQKQTEANHDRDESRTGECQSRATRHASDSAGRERSAATTEPILVEEAARMRQTLDAAQQAVSEAYRLHQDAQRVAERQPQQQPELENQRER